MRSIACLYIVSQSASLPVILLAFPASLKSLAEFLVNDKTTLDLLECPIDPFEHLEQPEDRLLYIEDNELHFLYEEVPKEKLH